MINLTLEFPEKYLKPLSKTVNAYDAVEKTHTGCGKLAVMEILCDAGNRTLLVIGSSGTGKSAVLRWLRDTIVRNKVWLDAVTIAGLKYLQKQLNQMTCSVLIDDVSKGGTEYSQVMTVCSMGELIYSGFVKKYTGTLQLEIEGFRGSAILNAQPLILKRIIRASEFETDIRDKVIRFYHIRKPINVVTNSPSDGIKYLYEYADVNISSGVMMSDLWKEGQVIFRYEFSKARAVEHYEALIRSCAMVNGRSSVEEADLWLVNELSKCFRLESEIFSKEDLEGERKLDVNLLPLLSVLCTYRSYPITALLTDFQVKESRLYQIISENKNYVAKIKNSGHDVIVPTSAGKELLTAIGEW